MGRARSLARVSSSPLVRTFNEQDDIPQSDGSPQGGGRALQVVGGRRLADVRGPPRHSREPRHVRISKRGSMGCKQRYISGS